MRVEDVYVQGRRTWVRLHEKGGKRHEMPCHHNLDAYLASISKGPASGGRAERAFCSGRAALAPAADRKAHVPGRMFTA